MRTLSILSFSCSLFLAVAVFCPTDNLAQTSCKSDGFFTLNGFCGNVTVELKCTGCTINGQELDFGGRPEGVVEVHFTRFSIAKNCTNTSINRFGNLYQLQLSPDCITGSAHLANPQIQNALLVYNKDVFTQTAAIKYRTTGRNGTGKLQLKYHFIKKSDEADAGSSFCFHCIEIPYTIKGIGDPDEIAWKQVSSQGPKEWCAFIKNYPSNRFVAEAKTKLKAHEETLWPNGSNNIKDYEAFKENMKDICPDRCTRCNEANGKIAAIRRMEQDEAFKKEREAFTSSKGNISLYQQYIKDYPKGQFIKEARDSIARLTPIVLEGPTEPDPEGWRTIRFLNFVGSVNYKISPPLNDADIDASVLRSDKTLRFRLTTSAEYSLYVEDSLYRWKNRRVDDLDNVFNAQLMSWDSLQLKIFLDKGTPTYSIEWIDEKGQTSWSKSGLSAGEHIFSIEELRNANLTGGLYKLLASDQSAMTPLEIGAISIPPVHKALPMWLIMSAVGLVVAAAGAIVFVLVRRKKRQPGTIWDVD